MADNSLIIGIDTGGTYTDAVVIDRGQQRILASAKALTTKGDLSVGVGEAMAQAVGQLGPDLDVSRIGLVSVSTTLATNAVVEGHGSSVAVILIGFDDKMVVRTGIATAFADLPILRVAGGHDHNGEQAQTLDEVALREGIAALIGKVGAFAIASTFAVRNNAHEIRARDLVAELTGLPVTLSSELSSSLDAPRRALTAVLNARLIAHISRLIAAVLRAMANLKFVCPLMIMKGDGTLALAESVAMRPIETVLSGPAASLVGAKWLSGLDDFIMSDMGGTTTDVGFLHNGRPQVAAEGAEVGGWRTMVKAIDVRTIGLGGDSEVSVGLNGKLDIGPQRAVPISLIAARHPEVLGLLKADLAETEGGSLLGKFLVLPFGRDDGTLPEGLSSRESDMLAMIGEMPTALRRVAVSSAAQRVVSALRKKGLVQLCAFTPSDAAHALDLQNNWNREAAVLSAQLMVRFRTMKMPGTEATAAFCHEVWSETVAKSCQIILQTALGDIKDSDELVNAVCEGRVRVGRVKLSLSPDVPIVAVGGPVPVYYREVGRRLAAEVVFAAYCDVANAVGAASAVVAERVVVTIEGDGNGAFRVHGAGRAEVFGSGHLALVHARELAQTIALETAMKRGAIAPKVTVDVVLNLMPAATDENGLLTATVTAEAVGRPAG